MQMGMPRVIKIVPMALLLSLLLFENRLHAGEPVTLTLSCDGTLTNMMSSDNDTKTETITKMGLLVNLAEDTVLGFNPPARVKKTDAASVDFAGEKGGSSVDGTIDRITGSVIATTNTFSASAKKLIASNSWDLHCKPTKRVF
jgi:hypothetical protein